MTLTKEDLEAIRGLIREDVEKIVEEVVERVIDKKLEPIWEEQKSLRKMFTTVINLQVEITDRIEVMEGQIKLIMLHLNLSPDMPKHRDTLKKLQ